MAAMGELAATGAQRLTLTHGPLRCELDPALGGSIAGLWWNGVPVLRETSAASPGDVRASASYPLVPYSNRIGHARLLWQGQAHRLVPNFPPEPHAIHGVGWRRSWELEACDGASARLRLRHAPDADWPFAFDARQEIRLSEQGIELSMQMTNRAAGAVPGAAAFGAAGLGDSGAGAGAAAFFTDRIDFGAGAAAAAPLLPPLIRLRMRAASSSLIELLWLLAAMASFSAASSTSLFSRPKSLDSS